MLIKQNKKKTTKGKSRMICSEYKISLINLLIDRIHINMIKSIVSDLT